jgi:tripartite-type tricarboxylate transporter receptor subunit TctC
MRLPRRQFLTLVPGALALPRLAWSQSYPARPVRLIVQVPAGSAPDIIARVMADWLAPRLGQQFVVDNRPGASGNIATEAVIRAPADGYSLLLAMSANAINASLYENLRSILPATPLRWRALAGSPWHWRSIRRFRRTRFPSS